MMAMRRTAWVLVMVGAAWAAWRCRDQPARAPVRVATFNIETFPKNPGQVHGAFEAIRALDAPAVALQEIWDPGTVRRAAREQLGPSWRFEWSERARTGVLYDSDVLALVSTAELDDTIVAPKQKPVLEVTLAPRAGPAIEIYVVHLMWGSEGRAIRARQYQALTGMLARARHRDERAVILGDFNATEDGDRDDLERLAAATRLTWATEPLACSAFWDRDDGCATSRLDHVLSSEAPSDVRASGACAEGCELRDRCPAWVGEVSDHCPVTVTLP